jgi:stage II sporulation protein D (peptidoglycan lytic transglycosylase)
MKRSLLAALLLALGALPSALGQAPGTLNQEPGTRNQEPGTLRIGTLQPGGGYTTTTVPLDTYVARVLAGEAARDSQPAALEALAIAIRTFALANRTRHRADGFDLCDQTHCQVVRTATAATERAARATSGRVLIHDGAPASIYYTASCGGRTEIPSHVWPGADDPSFLPSQPDDACEGDPAWSVDIEARDLARALRGSGFTGDRLRDLRVASRNGSGRVAVLKIDGFTPGDISGQDLRVAVGRTLGWQHIKSTAFQLQRRGDVYRFAGHGYGHGVGLCVIGSARLAERGVTADAILARYFPGLAISGSTPTLTAVTPAQTRPVAPAARRGAPPPAPAATRAPAPVPAPAIAVTLPDEDEGERAIVVRDALRARDEVARALGVVPPASVTLRFHPTTDDYERVTGRPWFTSAAVVRGELHLLPIATLRQRGLLDLTIRHELVHVMTDQALATRPAWVREGVAAYFAGGKPVAVAAQQRPAFRPAPKRACPSDSELLQPVSAGALANAYARARACFANQIEKGKSWREVR